jgi:hypothetical protein
MRDFAVWSWKNLNPRTFTIGKLWLVGWRMAGYGDAHDWYDYHNCIASSELVDFVEMLGTTKKEAIALRDHMINQGFYRIVFDLEYNDVKGMQSKYLLRLNVP